MPSFENFRARELSKREQEIFAALQKIEGASVTPATREVYGFVISFSDEEAKVTLHVTFFDQQSGADLAVTNMITLPRSQEISLETVRSQGRGSEALQKLVRWAKEEGYPHIIAAQVQKSARDFWQKNGFVYDERESNVSEDWVYKP